MNEIIEIVHEIPLRLLPNGEKVYNLLEFYEKLKEISHNIKCEDLILTPYYIFAGKRIELYEFELSIQIVDKLDYQKHLLEKTGKSKIQDIPEKIVSMYQICRIEITLSDDTVPVEKVIRYIEYLLENQEIANQVKKVFGKFEKQYLWFEVY